MRSSVRLFARLVQIRSLIIFFFFSFRVRFSKFLGFYRPESPISHFAKFRTPFFARIPVNEDNYQVTVRFNLIAMLAFLSPLFIMLLQWLEDA